ncbi:MAG: hypothetical protein ACYTG0_20635 [Planctomycetota bacterium]|jgi:hypothetical protein
MVHLLAEQRLARGELSPSQVRLAIRSLGIQQFDETRDVLRHEGLLLGTDDATAALIEATAVFWELYHFSGRSLRSWFPGIEDPNRAARVLRQVVDPDSVFSGCRPKGAPKPTAESVGAEIDAGSLGEDPVETPHEGPSGPRDASVYHKLAGRAERAAERGNLVRSLILWTRARSWAPREAAGPARSAVRENVDRLTHRLLVALEQPQADPDTWHAPLTHLVQLAADGFWAAEARLLYDLQKVCVDQERGAHRLDVFRWLVSLGRRPLRRPLPFQKSVSICLHLHSARRRLAHTRLSGEERGRLDALIGQASEKAEQKVRSEVRPVLRQALDEVGLQAENVPERVAARKMVEELLDRLVERGVLTMGDLRDALSRNHLKLHDLAHPKELVCGDQLLRVDHQLARSLEGVHRRGEFYLRWIQSISSLTFGTPVGRILTRFLFVPFGGAYALEAGIQHLLHKATGAPETSSPAALILLGTLFLLLINSGRFRRGFGRLMRNVGRATRFCLVDLPKLAFNVPAIRRVLRSRWFRLSYRLLLKPGTFTALICLATSGLELPWQWTAGNVAILFFFVALVGNSRLGRDMEEITADWLIQAWKRLGIQSFVTLFRWVMQVFRRAVDAVDRLLYAVDEWLRFRTGESRLSVVVKAVVTPVWQTVRYVVRFCVTLLIEPQINPIKHFPVVTVSHKILLPFIPAFASALSRTMDEASAWAAATTIIAVIPGACGFLVWELRENWRLYRANRPGRLRPVPVGSHGETIVRLLRPGFHSGTIPKRYTRLRGAEGHAERTGKWGPVRAHLLALQEIELSLHRYVQREFIALLGQSAAWTRPPLAVEEIRTGTNRIVAEMSIDGMPDGKARLTLDLCSHHLLSSFAAPDWLDQLDERQRAALEIALVGLYKTAGVDFVREAVESRLAPQVSAYYLDDNQIVFWIGPECQEEVTWDLDDDASSAETPRQPTQLLRPGTQLTDAAFGAAGVPYEGWVDAWSRLTRDGDRPKDLLNSVPVLRDRSDSVDGFPEDGAGAA